MAPICPLKFPFITSLILSRRGTRYFSDALRHTHNGERQAGSQWSLVLLHLRIALRAVKGNARQRRSHLQAAEAPGLRRRLTGIQNHSANSAAGPFRMDEEC